MSNSSQDIQIELDLNQEGYENPALPDVSPSEQKEGSFANIQMSFSIAPFLELNSLNEKSKLEKNSEPSKSDRSPCKEIEFEDTLKLPASADNSLSETVKTFFNELVHESNPLFNESDSGQNAEVPIGNPAPKIIENSVHSVKTTLIEDLYLSEDSLDNPDDVGTLNHHVPMERRKSIVNFDQDDPKLKNINPSKEIGVSSNFSTLVKENKLIQDSGDSSFTLVEEKKLKYNSDDCPDLMDGNELKYNSEYLHSNLGNENKFGQGSDDLSTCLVKENELIQNPEDLPSALVKENELTFENKDLPSAFVKENESLENSDDLPKALVKENELTQDNDDLSTARVNETESIENINELPSALVKENELTFENEDLPSAFVKENDSIENYGDLPTDLVKEKELTHDNEDLPSAFVKENDSIENYDDLPKNLVKEIELTQVNDDLPSALVKENESKQTYEDLLFALMKESNLGENSSVFPSTSEKENKLIKNACVKSALSDFIITLPPTSTTLKEQHELLNSITHGNANKTCADNHMSIIEKTDPIIEISNVLCDNEDSHGSPTFRIHSSTPLRGYVNFSHCPSISTGNSDYVQTTSNKEFAVVNSENVVSIGSETSSIDHNGLCNSIDKSSKDCNISDKVLDTTINDKNKLKTSIINEVENYNHVCNSDDILNKPQNKLCTVTPKKCDDGSVKLGFNLNKSCTITLDPNNYNISCIFKEPEDALQTPSSYNAQFSTTLLSNNSSITESLNFDGNQFLNSKTQTLSECKPSSPIPLEESIENVNNIFPVSQDLLDRELIPKQSATDSIASSSNVHQNILGFQKKRFSEAIEYLSKSSSDSSVVPSNSDSTFSIEKEKSSVKRKSNPKSRSKCSKKINKGKQTAKKTFSKKGKQSHKIPKSTCASIVDDISSEIVEDALKAVEEYRLKNLSESTENEMINSDNNFSSKKNKGHLKSISSSSIFKAKTYQRTPIRQMVLERRIGDSPSKDDSNFEKVPSEKNMNFQKQIAYKQESRHLDIDDSDISFSEDETKVDDAPMSSNNVPLSFEDKLKMHLNELEGKINPSNVIQNTDGKSGNPNTFSSIDQAYQENCEFEINEFNTGKRRFEDPTVVDDPYALFGSSFFDENNMSHSIENVETERVELNESESQYVSTSITDQHDKNVEIVDDGNCSKNSEDSSPLKSSSTLCPEESTGHISPTPQTFDNLMLKLFKEFSETVEENQISPKNMHASVIDQIKSDFDINDDINSLQGKSPLKDTNTELAETLTDIVLPTLHASEPIKGNKSASKTASDTIVDQIESDVDVFDDDNCSQMSEDSSSSKDTIVERPKKWNFTVSQTSVLVKGNHHASKNMSASTKSQIKSDFNTVEDNCSQSSEDLQPRDTNDEYRDELDSVSPIPNNTKNKNFSLTGVLVNNCDVSIHKDYTESTCSSGVEKVSDALEDLVVVPDTFEDILIKHMKEDKSVEKQPKPSKFIELIKNNSHVSFEDILTAHLEDVKLLEGNQNSSNVSELEKSNAALVGNSSSLGHNAYSKVSDIFGHDTDSQVSELDLFTEENNSISSDSEDTTKCEDSRISSNEQLNNAVTTQLDFGVLSSDNIISQFSSQASELMECNNNFHGSLVDESEAPDAKDCQPENEVKTVRVAITSRPSPIQVEVGRAFKTKDSVTKCIDKVNSVQNCESIENMNDKTENCENTNCIINETVEEDLTERTAIPVLKKSITKHKEKQNINTTKNYFSKSVCVDATAEISSMNKNLLSDNANINANNGGNVTVKSNSKNNFGNLCEFQTTDTESDRNVFNETEIASSTKDKISCEIKECFILLKRNETLPKDIGSNISKDNEDVFAVGRKSYLGKSNKYKEKLLVHKCEFSAKSIQIPSRYANLVGKNIESFKGVKNTASVLEVAKKILVNAFKESSCIDELEITTNIKPSLCNNKSDFVYEHEFPIDKDLSTEHCDIICLQDKLDKEKVTTQECFVLLEPVKTSTKCSGISMQPCHGALDPVVISSSIVNATEKVNESPNGALRTSPRKRILSTHDANKLAEIKRIWEISKDASTKTQNRNHGKRKMADTNNIDFKAKKKFKLQECFVLIEPLDLSSQQEHNNPASSFAVESKQSTKEKQKISNFKNKMDTSDNAEVVVCVTEGKVRKTRKCTKILDGFTKGQYTDDDFKTKVSGISMETRNQRENVFFLNQTSTYGVHTRLSSGIEKSIFKPTTAVNKKEELIKKDIQNKSTEENSCTLSKKGSSYSKFTTGKQSKRPLRRSKRKSSANFESSTNKQVCSELKAKTIEDYFQIVNLTHLHDADFERSAHSLKVILSNTVNYPDMSTLLFAVIKYLTLSENNALLSFAESGKTSVLLPQDEDCIVTAFFMIETDEKTHLKGLLKATINMIKNLLISRKTINIYGLASLCRVATEISKRKKDKLAPLTLCSNLLKSKHQFSPYLIASVVSVWMELFQVQGDLSDEEIIFHSSIAYGAKKRTDITESDWNVSMNIISKYQNSRPVADVQKSITVLMDIIQINCCDESWIHCYMLTSALVIFAVHEDWKWIKESLLNQFIVPELNKFGTNTIHNKAFDLFCNLYVDLFLMNPSTNPREEVLIKFFKKENITEGCSFIQENAALALMKFVFLKNISLPRILTRWFEMNRGNPKVIAIKSLFTRKSKSGDSKQLLEEDFELNVI